jgi:dihydroneopterin aldolase/2-amino-4-hydroxy-6-hydroxymethyldihydropteridine diphosphokinase
VPAEPADAIIALGANLGEALATLRSALADLRDEAGVEVAAVSPLARTTPVGYSDQPDFFNAVAHIRTTLSPRALLHTLQGIEEKHGRQRTVRGGPRTLDLDLIAYDTLLADEEELILPHPRAHERSFVLVPWSLMAPGAFLPGLGGGPVEDLAEAAPDQGCIRWLAPDWDRRPAPEPGAGDSAGPSPAGGHRLPAASVPPSGGQSGFGQSGAGPGMPGFFAEARRGRSAFNELADSKDAASEPLKPVPYQPLSASRAQLAAEDRFQPKLDAAAGAPPMPSRRPPSGAPSGNTARPEPAPVERLATPLAPAGAAAPRRAPGRTQPGWAAVGPAPTAAAGPATASRAQPGWAAVGPAPTAGPAQTNWAAITLAPTAAGESWPAPDQSQTGWAATAGAPAGGEPWPTAAPAADAMAQPAAVSPPQLAPSLAVAAPTAGGRPSHRALSSPAEV